MFLSNSHDPFDFSRPPSPESFPFYTVTENLGIGRVSSRLTSLPFLRNSCEGGLKLEKRKTGICLLCREIMEAQKWFMEPPVVVKENIGTKVTVYDLVNLPFASIHREAPTLVLVGLKPCG